MRFDIITIFPRDLICFGIIEIRHKIKKRYAENN